MNMTKEQATSLMFRFIRGGLAGSASVMVTMIGAGFNANGISSFKDLQLWMASLFFAGVSGFISGTILCIDKWARLE